MKNFCRYIIVGFTFLISQVSFAQIDKDKLIQLGLKNDTLMLVHINKGDYAAALEACSTKENYFFKSESWKYYIEARNDMAWIYHRTDNLKMLKETVFTNISLADKYLKNDNREWIRAKEQVNSYYYLIGDYKSALEIIKEVIPIKEKLNLNKFEIGITYQNLGNAYNRLRDTDNALRNFKKSIKVLHKEGERMGLSVGERFNNIARTYKSRGDLDSALTYLDLAESLLDTINIKGQFKSKRVDTYILLVETWLEKKDFAKAKYYLDLADKLPLNKRESIVRLERLAKYYREISEFDKSEEIIMQAIGLAEESGIRNFTPHQARRNIELVKTLVSVKRSDAALNVLQNSLQILAPSFTSNDFQSNPTSDLLFDKPDALIILQEKARILKREYTDNNEIDYLKSAYRTYLTACDVIRDVRQGIRSADSKNDLSKTSISVYEEAIQVAYELSKLDDSEDYISVAFKLAESNKAQLLLENLNEQEARGFEGIPDSLLNKEKGLRLYLATLEDRALREGRNGNDDDNIFALRQELNQFSSFLEKSYPRYFQLKYNNEPISPSYVQDQLLDDNEAVIEYFVGAEKIFVFIITKEQFYMQEMQNRLSEMQQIGRLRNILKNRPGSESPEVEYGAFVNTSREVYTSFVKGALDKLPKSINRLIIIPDDQINYIPFEVLLLEAPDGQSGYSLNSQSYLFEEYAVNYNYSTTLLNKVVSKDASDFKANFIGYAPTFAETLKSETRSAYQFELSNLKCNKDEVSSIESIIGGEKRISDVATKENFLREVNDYRIVHLATHAFVNQTDSKMNRIFLQDDFLSDVNLYNLELNTELAVLSACNTGSGELLKGEGVMNLARGFINAGCSSTLMSMWSVDDCATADLMRLFYKGIKEGLHKDEALRRAKIDYLNSAKKAKLHPYYWAAFIPFGDMKAVELSSVGMGYMLPVVLAIGFLVLLFLYFRRKG